MAPFPLFLDPRGRPLFFGGLSLEVSGSFLFELLLEEGFSVEFDSAGRFLFDLLVEGPPKRTVPEHAKNYQLFILQILHGNSYGLSNQMTKYKSTKIEKNKSTK